MNFKLDENLPTGLVAELQKLGHDADTVMQEELQGAPDPTILQAATAACRILPTLNKGIANL